MDAMDQLRDLIASEKKSILEFDGHGTPAEMLRDITRAVDACSLRRLIYPEDQWTSADELALRGANIALGLVQTAQAQSNSLIYADETPNRLAWADTTLNVIGVLAHLEGYLASINTGLASLRQIDSNTYRITLGTTPFGLEALEREDAYVRFKNEEANNENRASQKEIVELLRSSIQPKLAGHIRSATNRLIDDFYWQDGQRAISRMPGNDAFRTSSVFGELKFETYKKILAMIVGLAHEHLIYADGLIAHNKKYSRRWVFTPIGTIDKLAERIGQCVNEPIDVVKLGLSHLTLTLNNTKEHMSSSDMGYPPLIQAGPSNVILSWYGSVAAPMEFLLTELRFRYPKDWDRAGDDRESMWRPELYALLQNTGITRFVVMNKGVKIRDNGKVVTDIDAAVFDRETGRLGLFQLKWQDIFARDMYMRSSRLRNYFSKAHEWVHIVDSWLAAQSREEICMTFGLSKKDAARFSSAHLFVLGRYFAHFSGQPRPDVKSAWATWGQVLRLVPSESDHQYRDYKADPIKWLDEAIRNDSPYDRANFDIEPERFEILGKKIIIG